MNTRWKMLLLIKPLDIVAILIIAAFCWKLSKNLTYENWMKELKKSRLSAQKK